MKKNLRNILVLAMGLMTTVSFAQTWDVDSRTRIDMSGDGDEMSTDQRATVGATWGGSDWGIHVSSDVNYTFEDGTNPSMKIYEAHASTDLMGYASVTAGRQALDYGSGAIMGSNQFDGNNTGRTTWDGFNIGLDLDMADITFGYGKVSNSVYDGVDAVIGVDAVAAVAADSNGVGGVDAVIGVDAVDAVAAGNTNMWINVAKSEGDWKANLLYMSKSTGSADAMTAMGLDLGYAMMGGDLNLDVSYNTATGYAAEDMDMLSIGATYQVNESMSISGNQTTYGENGFDVNSANMQGMKASGSLGYLGANDQDRNFGVSYNMGDFNLGASMHQITNTGEGALNEAYKRDVMDISIGYTMSANANLSVKYATDSGALMVEGSEDDKYTWVTLNITP
jgi:hypothetical protein